MNPAATESCAQIRENGVSNFKSEDNIFKQSINPLSTNDAYMRHELP